MYASIDFVTKKELRQAVSQGQDIVAYSPTLGMAAVTGRTRLTGPWPLQHKQAGERTNPARNKNLATWNAWVDVKDMRIVAVH